MIDIAYIISHGFAARMVTQTDLLGKLVAAGKSVALICPDKNDPNLSDYCRLHAIPIHEFNERGGFWNENYMFKRKYFLEDIEGNPALMDKHIHATRYNSSHHPLRRIRPYYYWWVYKLIPLFPSIRKRFIAREKKNLKSSKAAQLIEQLQPKKLISTYPVNFNEAVLLHYGNMHPAVQTWIHLLSWDNITCKGHFPETADKYIAWGPIMEEELQTYYQVKPENIFATGVPHFDIHFQVNQTPNVAQHVKALGLHPDIPYLFFAMSSPRFAPGEIQIVEWLAAEMEKQAFGELQLIVRPHPQNVTGNLADKSWLPRLAKLGEHRHTAVDFPEVAKSKLNWSMKNDDMVRLANLLTGSKMVINSGSTVSIDGLLHHKPIIITAFDGHQKFSYWKSARRLIDYPHLKKLIDAGGITVTKSFETFEHALRQALADDHYRLDERNRTLLLEIYKPDGGATERVVNKLIAHTEMSNRAMDLHSS